MSLHDLAVVSLNLSQINPAPLCVSDEQQQWEEILRQEGLSMTRGENKRRLFYGSNDQTRLQETSWEDASIWITKKRKDRTPAAIRVRKCAVCHSEFSARRDDATTCSPKCRKRKERTSQINPAPHTERADV